MMTGINGHMEPELEYEVEPEFASNSEVEIISEENTLGGKCEMFLSKAITPCPPGCVCTSKSDDGHPEKWMDLRHMYHLPRKLLFSILGILILSLAIAICRAGDVGVDPFTSMNIGISEKLGMSLGNFQLIVNIAILVVVFFLDKWQIGLGTLINMVAVGYLVDFFSIPLSLLPAPNGDIVIMGIYLVIGTLLFTMGISMYLKTGMGVSPYDAVAPMLSDRLHRSYTVCRVAQDVTVLVVAWFVAGPFGVFTIIAAFCAGPLITMWDKVTEKVYKRFNVLNAEEIVEEFTPVKKNKHAHAAA